jgi:hypothetical protein
MFIRDASRPITRKRVFEGFRFTNAFKRILHSLFDHVVDAAKDLSIGVLPIECGDALPSRNSSPMIRPFSARCPTIGMYPVYPLYVICADVESQNL